MSKIRISCDDGCSSDMRLADLCSKYEIECIFYWPVEWKSLAYSKDYEPLTYHEAQYIADNYKIGSHGYTHRYLTRISYLDAVEEICESKIVLENMFNKEIDSFCFPRGYSNKELEKAVLNSQYKDYRLTRGVDSTGNKLVHVHPNSGSNDNKPWQECITEKTHLWMHSFELDRFSLWDELEEVLESV